MVVEVGEQHRGADIAVLAREHLGFDELRAGQRHAVEAVVSGRDVLVVMPTGSGKTAIYQLAGAVLARPVVVVSPLIALQRDQVEGLAGSGFGAARELNSTMGAGARDETLADLAEGRVQFVLLSPEQLANAETLQAVASAEPALFVVDEAHCVTSWGHDFRPDYLHLASAMEAVGRPRILALTATAAPPVRDAIVSALGMQDPVIVVEGFDRPNIFLSVRSHHDPAEKRQDLLDWVGQRAGRGPGIVYVATRAETEELAADIGPRGLRAGAYHGGLGAAAREEVYRAFMGDELDVVVATTAFGMGIDKPNVAFVAHYEISDSLDSYYQEIGRAGRDGAPAEAVLCYRSEDLGLRRYFASGGEVDEEDLAAVAGVLAAGDRVTVAGAGEAAGLAVSQAERALDRLVEVGAAARTEEGAYVAVAALAGEPPGDVADVVAAEARDAQDSFRLFQLSRVEMMRSYAETRSCRGELLLAYFGEPGGGPCNHCDLCSARGREGSTSEDALTFSAGSRVAHRTWGEGQVILAEGEQLTVLFERVGYKTLSLPLVEEGGLLELIQRPPGGPAG